MTTPGPRNHTEKPDTPPAGPSGVSWQFTTPEVQQALNHIADVIGGTLRQILTITGHPNAPAAAAAPNHLDAMRQAYAEGHGDGMIAAKRGDPDDDELDNPYGKLLDDRRAFVREQVDNAYGGLVTDDDEFVLGDDNAEWFDAVLDAHDEWLALQRHIEPQPAAAWRDDVVNVRIRAEQAEARVAALDGVLRRLADTTAPDTSGDRSYEDMVDDARTVLTRAGYGDQPADDAPAELCGDSPVAVCGNKFDGYVGKYACTEPAGHTGVHRDGQHGTTWVTE
ncbi:hypothetical protein SEA_JUJU_86 [Gordonia phage JuJu]|uniref:Uncharacterized protein n=1 Tax=Gordonia phage JuJu TaxID=2590929 RepID=A0A516KR83_9CAUD|nr:hypothetical protein KNU69_gp86 [Gordonia phage JuJu]QDP44202.1 hypothetical protein SEA_JUJU_86 [Gordonia phage JuJu]